MGGDTFNRRPFYLSDCMSPSCVPVHEEYSRVYISQDKGHRCRRLRKLFRKIVSESRCIYSPPKALRIQYDAISYSQNFDEGCHREDEYPRAVSASLPRFQLATTASLQHLGHNK